MTIKTVVRRSEFYDSIFLMRISEEASKIGGVRQAVALMATDLNKELLENIGLLTEDAKEAGPSDLVIALEAETEDHLHRALKEIDGMLSRRRREAAEEYFPYTLESALEMMPDANVVTISVPGEFARREALTALRRGLHVFLFSSNVSLEEELELKTLARRRGLLMMGPDCGTALINGVTLGFGNALRKGPIGIVAAAGTGIQQVGALIHGMGSGISHAIGTGGRDLAEEIGGITMSEGLKRLEGEEGTEVIVLISKPPSPPVAEKILGLAKRCGKPVVVNFIGADPTEVRKAGLIPAVTLEEAAYKAVALARGEAPRKAMFVPISDALLSVAAYESAKLTSDQKYVRGFFSGGTLCYESISILEGLIGDIYSNTPIKPGLKLPSPHVSKGHTCVDMGAMEFVAGRPHPMIDPTLRSQRILREAGDPETAVILLDIVLGYGAHPDPAGALASSIKRAKRKAEDGGRHLPVVASLIGTELDVQGVEDQKEKLMEDGVIVLPSNAQATRVAALIATRCAVKNVLPRECDSVA